MTSLAPLQSDDGSYDVNSVGNDGWWGLLTWAQGSLLVSLLWVSMIVNVLDRKWIPAAIWAIISSLFAVTGIIHSFSAGFTHFLDPSWKFC
jgi:formate-dependent nitrite reductase membrane component NrfD